MQIVDQIHLHFPDGQRRLTNPDLPEAEEDRILGATVHARETIASGTSVSTIDRAGADRQGQEVDGDSWHIFS